jgi:acetyltransferase-like isoleucine patch superfamily enzyme
MRKYLRAAWWGLFDPLVRKFQARQLHLSVQQEVPLEFPALRGLVDADPTTRLMSDARISSCGDRSHIRLGAHTMVRGTLNVLAATGHIHMGTHCYVGSGAQLWSQIGIDIGNRVLIAHHVDIHDTNAHPVDPEVRAKETIGTLERLSAQDWSLVACAPVRIEDDVWLGFKSTVLKGVTIGRGAIVAAGAVVTEDVPAKSIVAGNPARVVGTSSK